MFTIRKMEMFYMENYKRRELVGMSKVLWEMNLKEYLLKIKEKTKRLLNG